MRKSKVAFIILLISLATGFFFTYKVVVSGSLVFDKSATSIFLRIFPEQTQSFFKLATTFGSKVGIGLVSIGLILWLWFKKRNFAGIVVTVIGVGLGNELNILLKNVIERPRPVLEHLVKVNSFSFPSGHAMVSIIVYMIVGYFLVKELKKDSIKWTAGVVLSLVVFLIGMSRVVLHVHFPSDIFGGFAIGYAWTYMVIIAYEAYLEKKAIRV